MRRDYTHRKIKNGRTVKNGSHEATRIAASMYPRALLLAKRDSHMFYHESVFEHAIASHAWDLPKLVWDGEPDPRGCVPWTQVIKFQRKRLVP
jgi:hypothetical protein